MKKRPGLTRQIIAAWRDCIREDYRGRRINSEHALQVLFCSRLFRELQPSRTVFVEPTILGRVPDLVVCNSREIIGIIELKFQPWAQPGHLKDIETLALLAAHRGTAGCPSQVEVSNERYRGPGRPAKKYRLSDRVLFVWAGVHADQPTSEGGGATHFASRTTILDGCYLELHAATRETGNPEVYRWASWKGGSKKLL